MNKGQCNVNVVSKHLNLKATHTHRQATHKSHIVCIHTIWMRAVINCKKAKLAFEKAISRNALQYNTFARIVLRSGRYPASFSGFIYFCTLLCVVER